MVLSKEIGGEKDVKLLNKAIKSDYTKLPLRRMCSVSRLILTTAVAPEIFSASDTHVVGRRGAEISFHYLYHYLKELFAIFSTNSFTLGYCSFDFSIN